MWIPPDAISYATTVSALVFAWPQLPVARRCQGGGPPLRASTIKTHWINHPGRKLLVATIVAGYPAGGRATLDMTDATMIESKSV